MRKWPSFFLLAILVAGIGAYFLRELVHFYILVPLVIISRIGRIVYNAIPEVYIWILFLIVGLLIVLIRLSKKTSIPPNPFFPAEKWESRAKQLSKLIQTAPKNEYSKWMLARKITEVMINLLIFQERLSSDQIILNIRRGAISMPAVVKDYLLAGMDMPSFRHYAETRKFWRMNLMASPFDINPEIIIEYLESRL